MRTRLTRSRTVELVRRRIGTTTARATDDRTVPNVAATRQGVTATTSNLAR